MVVHAADHRVVDAKDIGGRAVAAGAEHEINIPWEQYPLAIERFISIHVFAAAITVRIPIPHGMLRRKNAHPFFHVNQVFHLRGVGAILAIDRFH